MYLATSSYVTKAGSMIYSILSADILGSFGRKDGKGKRKRMTYVFYIFTDRFPIIFATIL